MPYVNPARKLWELFKRGLYKLFLPLVRGLLQNVPFVLDHLWRRIDFRASRVGYVDCNPEHRFIPRPVWRHGVLLLWAVLCSFAVFGPTTDAWCSLNGAPSAAEARIWVGRALIASAAIVLLLVLNLVSSYMARMTYRRLDAAPVPPVPDSTSTPKSALPPPAGPAVRFVQETSTNLIRSLFENTARLLAWIPRLPRGERAPTFVAFVALFVGAVLIIVPLLSLGGTILTSRHDPLSCALSDHPGYIVAQAVALAVLWGGGLLIWSVLSNARALAKLVLLSLLFTAVFAALWSWFTPAEPSEAIGGFYPHVYLLLVAALLVVALISKPFAKLLFWKFEPEHPFRAALSSTDLLDQEIDPKLDLSFRRILSAFTHGISGHWLHFLLLPAFVALFAPSEWLLEFVGTAAVVSALLLMYGSLSSRWEQMLVYVQRRFLLGTPLVMSVAVIVVAALRFAKVQYVATVLDAAPIGVLTIFIGMMYVAFWFFEYFVNRWLGEELLTLVSKRKLGLRGYVRCNARRLQKASWASATGRYLSLHGTGRMLVQGWFERAKPGFGEQKCEQAFTTYGFAELFATLGKSSESAAACARAVGRNVRLYFTVVNLLLIFAGVGLYCWHRNWSLPLVLKPMVTATAQEPEKIPVDSHPVSRDPLAERLLAQTRESRPSIIVAASGGGTRAAVYTAVALEGMAKIRRARDVVLLSGVSGGGVSAAVFASRFDVLKDASPPADPTDLANPWSQYIAATAEPYIQDVLEGAGELRVSANSALGVLLAESLERRAFAASMTNVRTIGELHDVTLILNSGITGHPYRDSELLRSRVAAPADTCVGLASPYANLAGGRLIFTNLTNIDGFPKPSALAPDMWLPYRIVNDRTVKLAAASALTANFPPVFPNARVRIIEPQSRDRTECAAEDPSKRNPSCDCNRVSYFVTDGGATENLGLVSALFALAGTLEKLAPQADPANPGQSKPATPLSDIHILALEASAVDYDYSGADRGIGAATGGSKERINAGLTQVLLERIARLLEKHHAKLHVHYLPLPVAFRSRGGFGTHWMFANQIEISNPLLAVAARSSSFSRSKSGDKVNLRRTEVLALWRSLFNPEQPVCALAAQAKSGTLPDQWTPNVATVARWICGHDDRRERGPALREPLPDFQVEAWAQTIKELGTPTEVRDFAPYTPSESGK